jgi:altronate dehydratase
MKEKKKMNLTKVKNYYQREENNYIDIDQVIMVDTTTLNYCGTRILLYKLHLANGKYVAVKKKEFERLFPQLEG